MKGKPANRGKRISNKALADLWNNPDVTLRQIGEMLGVTVNAVRCRAKARGLPKRFDAKVHASAARKIHKAQEPMFRAMYLAHVSTAEIARHFGISHTNVARVAKRIGIPNRGVLHPSRSITVAQYRENLILAQMAETARRETKRAKAEGILGRAIPAPQPPKPLQLEHRIGA
jgi:AraC-like DNA-binding protein